jgi:molecular chaperone DnaK (HSP70)
MVFDFGGGTLDVSIVKIELSGHGDRKSVVVGKGGAGIGGIDIDTWIMEDLLKQNGMSTGDVQHIINHLRQTVEEIKIDLSFNKEASLSVFDDVNGTMISADYTREKFEEILTKNNLFNIIQEILDDSLEGSSQRHKKKRHKACVDDWRFKSHTICKKITSRKIPRQDKILQTF